MRILRTPTIVALVFCVLALALVACDMGGSSGGTSGGLPTATTKPQTTKVSLKPGDTALCAVVTLAEVGQIAGGTITNVDAQVIAGEEQGAPGAQFVSCNYLDRSNPQRPIARATTLYYVGSDSPRLHAQIKQSVSTESEVPIADVPGVGDAAFGGTLQAATIAITNLYVLRGNLVLIVQVQSVNAPSPAGLSAAKQLAQLVLSRV